jgi:hypothetical protein
MQGLSMRILLFVLPSLKVQSKSSHVATLRLGMLIE